MKLFRKADGVFTLAGAAAKSGRHIKDEDLSCIEGGSLLIEKGKILWVGSDQKIPPELVRKKKLKEFSCQGMVLLPGLVEAHTHTLFAGQRENEFELRNQGVSYLEIAKQGGGILSTMRATRLATASVLKDSTQKRVQAFVRQGVTTLEIKTGYALDEKNEIKCLKVLNSLSESLSKQFSGPRIVPTFLGAHARPPEFDNNAEYLDFLLTQVLPKIKKQKLSRRVDIFVENGFFTQAEADVYLAKARAMGFSVLVHADQISLSGGSDVAIAHQALSADHVIQIKEKEINNIAKSEVTAVLLPMADLYMKCAYPPARKLIDAGARVALATDFNPGSCPSQDIATVGMLARLEMKMTRAEVLGAYTIGAAHALGLQKKVGSLEVGKEADFAIFDGGLENLFYSVGSMQAKAVFRAGKRI